MPRSYRRLRSLLLPALVLAAPALAGAAGRPDRVDPRHLPAVGHTDARYLSYNIDMAELTWGGHSPLPVRSDGKPADQNEAIVNRVLSGVSTHDLDLANPRLRLLARALGPAYLRVSGTAANSVYFQDNDEPPLAHPPAGFGSVLTRANWKSVVNFARAADVKILTSFTVNPAVRNADGVWTPKEAGPLIAYTHAIGADIYAAELFNEPNLPSYGGAPKGYDAALFARDEEAFHAFARKAAPSMKIVGPGDVVVANVAVPGTLTGAQLMEGKPTPRFDIISYHFYPAVAARCAPAGSPVGTTPAQALSEDWLARTDASFRTHKALRDRYAPGAPIWNTETGGAACSGARWDSTYLDTFRFLDQLGRLARQGASVVFHQTLVGGNYGLLDPGSYDPRPNYWAALLWHRLMGARVLDAGPNRPGLHLYAHCLAQHPGGVALLAINTSESRAQIHTGVRAQVYTLSAPELQSSTTLLNGRPLALGRGDALPMLRPVAANAKVVLPPRTSSFIALPGAGNRACR